MKKFHKGFIAFTYKISYRFHTHTSSFLVDSSVKKYAESNCYHNFFHKQAVNWGFCCQLRCVVAIYVFQVPKVDAAGLTRYQRISNVVNRTPTIFISGTPSAFNSTIVRFRWEEGASKVFFSQQYISNSTNGKQGNSYRMWNLLRVLRRYCSDPQVPKMLPHILSSLFEGSLW